MFQNDQFVTVKFVSVKSKCQCGTCFNCDADKFDSLTLKDPYKEGQVLPTSPRTLTPTILLEHSNT